MSYPAPTMLMLWGDCITDRSAWAEADFNGLGWDEPDVVAGRITYYRGKALPAPGDEFIVTGECDLKARAVYVRPMKLHDGRKDPSYADFRVVEWLSS